MVALGGCGCVEGGCEMIQVPGQVRVENRMTIQIRQYQHVNIQ